MSADISKVCGDADRFAESAQHSTGWLQFPQDCGQWRHFARTGKLQASNGGEERRVVATSGDEWWPRMAKGGGHDWRVATNGGSIPRALLEKSRGRGFAVASSVSVPTLSRANFLVDEEFGALLAARQTAVVARCLVVAHSQQIKMCGQSYQDRHASSWLWRTVRTGISVGCPYGRFRKATHSFNFGLVNQEFVGQFHLPSDTFWAMVQESSCSNGAETSMCARFTTGARNGSCHQCNVDQHFRVSETHPTSGSRIGWTGWHARPLGRLHCRAYFPALCAKETSVEGPQCLGNGQQIQNENDKAVGGIRNPSKTFSAHKPLRCFGVKMRTIFGSVSLEPGAETVMFNGSGKRTLFVFLLSSSTRSVARCTTSWAPAP